MRLQSALHGWLDCIPGAHVLWAIPPAVQVRGKATSKPLTVIVSPCVLPAHHCCCATELHLFDYFVQLPAATECPLHLVVYMVLRTQLVPLSAG
jgi:hypothetical protein